MPQDYISQLEYINTELDNVVLALLRLSLEFPVYRLDPDTESLEIVF